MKSLPIVLAALLSGSQAVQEKVWVDSEERVIRDGQDRHVLFHGVNVVYKVPPYIPDVSKFDSQRSLTDEDIQNLKAWGFNLVRLGVMWEAVETAPGKYDENYLEEVNTLINKLGEAGIYTLVDAHQDVLSSTICGEGMPAFYAKEVTDAGTYCFGEWEDKLLAPLVKQFGFCKPIADYGYRYDSSGFPLIEDCQKNSFFIYYTSPEAFTLFRAFYNNDFGVQDKYVAYWEKVANKFSSNPNVIGFDPFNEPLPSWKGLLGALKTVSFGNYDRHELTPLYERINEKY